MEANSESPGSDARKLTLRIDGALIARAKQYARDRGTSLSQMISDYFRAITAAVPDTDADQDWKKDLPPTTRALVGIAAKENVGEDAHRRYLIKKYT